MSDPHDDSTIERQLEALRFADPTPSLRRRTLAAARAELAGDDSVSSSWTVELLLAAASLLLALTLAGADGPVSPAPRSVASPDVLALVAAVDSPIAARRGPADRPLHADRPTLRSTTSETSPCCR